MNLQVCQCLLQTPSWIVLVAPPVDTVAPVAAVASPHSPTCHSPEQWQALEREWIKGEEWLPKEEESPVWKNWGEKGRGMPQEFAASYVMIFMLANKVGQYSECSI